MPTAEIAWNASNSALSVRLPFPKLSPLLITSGPHERYDHGVGDIECVDEDLLALLEIRGKASQDCSEFLEV